MSDESWPSTISGVHPASHARRLFFLAVFLSLIGGPAPRAGAAAAINFAGPELLVRPTADSITIQLVPDEAIEYYVEYGPAPGAYTGQTTPTIAAAGQPHQVVISGLEANTHYTYRMRYHAPGDDMDDWVIRDQHSFWTQRARNSTFTFTIVADSHMNGGLGIVSLHEATLDNVSAPGSGAVQLVQANARKQ